MPSAVALLAAAFALGVALREATLASPPLVAWVAALSTVLCVAAVYKARRRGRWLPALALLHTAVLGALGSATARPATPRGLFHAGHSDVIGHVAAPPERALGHTRVLIDVDAIAGSDERGAPDAGRGEKRVQRSAVPGASIGTLQLGLTGDPVEPLLPGDRVRFAAKLSPPRGHVEPDSPDPELRYAERRVIAVAGVPSPAALVKLSDGKTSAPRRVVAFALRRAAALRERLSSAMAEALDGDRLALVESLVLGERGGISQELDDAFRAAGVTHVLSVSGLHLAIAAFFFYVGLRRLLVTVTPLSRRVAVSRIAAAFALPATAFYTVLTGAAVATVRACVVAWVYLLGAMLLRPPTAIAAMGAAALLLLFASPLALYDPSFQLSFAAALGASLLAPPVIRWLREHRLARLHRFLDGKSPRWKAWPARLVLAVVGLIVTSASAILATAPITAWHFAQVAPAGVVANVVVVPLAELWVLPVGLAGCALVALPSVADALFRVAGAGAACMARAARFFAALFPPGHVRAPTLVEAALFYAALTSLWLASAAPGFRARRAFRLAALLCATALLSSVAAHELAPILSPRLTLHFLDVGQGDACLVELPDGKTMLVDGGGSFNPEFDPGAQLIAPWLLRRGVRRLDVVVLTHPHPDHANGLASVVDRFPVGEIWENGAASSLPGLRKLEETAARHHVPVLRPHALSGPAPVAVLHPLVDGVVRPPLGYSENDASIVLRITYAGRAALLSGDIEARAEARLLDAGLPLRADVLKAPHHGSRTSSTQPFVDAVRPSVVVFSVGADNQWGFPAGEVVARYRALGARTLRTDLDGAVSVRIDHDGQISVERARKRSPAPAIDGGN